MSCNFSITNDSYIYTHLACGLLSLLGSLFIIIFCIYLKALRVYSFKLIFYFSISQLLSSLEFIFPVTIQNSSQIACSLFGFLTNSSQMISVLWMTCIANCIRQAFVGHTIFYEKHEIYWAIFALLVIPLLNIIPAITESYAAVNNSCTYNQKTAGTLERIFIFFVPVWGMLIYSIGCYVQIFLRIKKTEVSYVFKSIIKKLMFYPMLMSFNVILYTFERLPIEIDECNSNIIWFIVRIIVSLNGFFNFIVFVCTPGTIKKMHDEAKNESIDELADLSSSLPIYYESTSKI
jgi:hypothetical protein